MTLVMTSLSLTLVFQCLFTFTLISALHLLAEIWQLSWWRATGELEVEFKFQRQSCKLSFLFPPHCQSPGELARRLTSIKRIKVCLYQEKWLKFRIEQSNTRGILNFRAKGMKYFGPWMTKWKFPYICCAVGQMDGILTSSVRSCGKACLFAWYPQVHFTSFFLLDFVFCQLHRLPEQHNCVFDHKESGRQEARKKMVSPGPKKVGRSFQRIDEWITDDINPCGWTLIIWCAFDF